MLLGTPGASLLENLLTGGKVIMRAGEGIMRAGYGAKKKLKSLLPFHLLTNFDIMDYYKNEPRFNGVYSRNNLPKKIKKGAYVINLDEYNDICTHWIALYVSNNCIYFDSFGVEHIPKSELDMNRSSTLQIRSLGKKIMTVLCKRNLRSVEHRADKDNFIPYRPIGHAKNGCGKRNLSPDREATRNISFFSSRNN